jgi:tetratricopeptide (TPR) repeat protein
LSTRRYDESIAQFQKALDLYPNAAVIRASLAWAYAMKRMYPHALTEYDKIADQDKAVAAENQFVAGGLGWVHAVSGRRADALKIAKEFRDLSSHLCRFLSSCGDLCGPRRQRRGVPAARKGLRGAFG